MVPVVKKSKGNDWAGTCWLKLSYPSFFHPFLVQQRYKEGGREAILGKRARSLVGHERAREMTGQARVTYNVPPIH